MTEKMESAEGLARVAGFVVIMVPEPAYAALRQHAAETGKSVSEVVGEAFEEYAQRHSR